MQDPKTIAIVNALVVVLLGYQIFFTAETSSALLNWLMYIFFGLALASLVWAIVRLSR